MNISSISEFFNFTPLDIKRSAQLKKEHPYVYANKLGSDSYEIELGPHKTTLKIEGVENAIPIHHCTCVISEKRGSCHHLLLLIDLIGQNKTNNKNRTLTGHKKKALPTLKKMLLRKVTSPSSNNPVHRNFPFVFFQQLSSLLFLSHKAIPPVWP